jgi:hypothetical protein
MEIDTLEYSQVKATSVSVRLRIFSCSRLKYPTSFLTPLPGMVAFLESNQVHPFLFLFTTVLSPPSYHMDFMPIYKFFAPKGDLLEPPPLSHPILIGGYELRPAFIAMVQEKFFSGLADEDPYTHLREFEQLCSCWSFASMTQETLKWKLFLFSLLGTHSVRDVNGNWDELRDKFCLVFFPLFLNR